METIIIFAAKYLIYLIVLAVMIYIYKQPRKQQNQILVLSVIILLLSYVVAKVAGYFYFNPRPFAVGNFTPLVFHVADNGFPSDHMLLSSALAAIVFCFNKKIGSVLFAGALLVGVGRVAAGVHHGLDILGSFVIVSIVTLFAWQLLFKNIIQSSLYRKYFA